MTVIILTACAETKQQVKTTHTSPNSLSVYKDLDTALKDATESIVKSIPQNNRIALLNFDSPSDKMALYVLDELATNLVEKKKYTVVDRKEIDLIMKEQTLQYSGEFSNESAQDIGKFLGAQYIVSGSYMDLGQYCRIMIRVLNVQTTTIEVQYRDDVQKNSLIVELLKGGKTQITQTPRATPQTPITNNQQTEIAQPQTPPEPPIQGTMVPGTTLSEKLAWLTNNADSHNTYIVEATANESISPYTFEYQGTINITIVLKGDEQNRTIRLNKNGSMFTIKPKFSTIL
jgi:TolB-like protein